MEGLSNGVNLWHDGLVWSSASFLSWLLSQTHALACRVLNVFSFVIIRFDFYSGSIFLFCLLAFFLFLALSYAIFAAFNRSKTLVSSLECFVLKWCQYLLNYVSIELYDFLLCCWCPFYFVQQQFSCPTETWLGYVLVFDKESRF